MRIALIVLLSIFPLTGCKSAGGNTPSETRHLIDEEATRTLNELYAEKADLRQSVESAPGYAVFSQRGLKIFLAGTKNGYGVVVDNETKNRTYMRMGGVDVGVGMGFKDYRLVLVFRDSATMDRFVESGWEFGGDADAAAKAGDTGGAADASANLGGIAVYQITDTGLALQASVGGTKYWKDKELN